METLLETAKNELLEIYEEIKQKYNFEQMLTFLPTPTWNKPFIQEEDEKEDEEPLQIEVEDTEYDKPQEFASNQDAPTNNATNYLDSQIDMRLLSVDIEQLLKEEGITHVGKKRIKFGRRGLRPKGAKYGSSKSWHYVLDKYTGNASARDISIYNGTDEDYAEFRMMLLSNARVRNWMATKGWGIINEITPAALKRTRGTGRHFHFGPDKWAQRTWKKWLENPNIPVTQIL